MRDDSVVDLQRAVDRPHVRVDDVDEHADRIVELEDRECRRTGSMNGDLGRRVRFSNLDGSNHIVRRGWRDGRGRHGAHQKQLQTDGSEQGLQRSTHRFIPPWSPRSHPRRHVRKTHHSASRIRTQVQLSNDGCPSSTHRQSPWGPGQKNGGSFRGLSETLEPRILPLDPTTTQTT